MSEVVRRLVETEQATDGVFRTVIPSRGSPRLFGGQVAAQAMLAASRTVEPGRPVHSLHSYFLLAGRPDEPIEYHVDTTRDGRSFTTRHVRAVQRQTVIFELLASFQRPEPGTDWRPEVPELGELPPPGDPLQSRLNVANYLDLRSVAPATDDEWSIHPYWFKTLEPIGDDPLLHAALLTFVSDLGLMASARAPGPRVPMAAAASLDHALWFHRPPDLDDWLLFSTETVANAGVRGLVRGSFHTRDGVLVASVAQEALLRPQEPQS